MSVIMLYIINVCIGVICVVTQCMGTVLLKHIRILGGKMNVIRMVLVVVLIVLNVGIIRNI